MTPEQARRMAEEVELPEPDGYIAMSPSGSIIVPPREFAKHNAYAVFTAGQVRESIAAALVKSTQGQEPVVARYVTRHGYAANWYDYSAHTDAVWREDMKISGGHIEYAYVIPSQQEERVRELEEDKARLDEIASEYYTIEAFDMPTGADDADVGWRVKQFWVGEKEPRLVAEVFKDDLRTAIDLARNKEQGK